MGNIDFAARAIDPHKFDVMGVPVNAVGFQDAVDTIAGWIEDGGRRYVCITGVHGIIECQSDAHLMDIHRQADMVTPDGRPLSWVAHMRGLPHVQQVYGPHLMLALSKLSADRGYKQFYYGGGDGIADRLSDVLQKRFPGLNVAGTYTPPFRQLSAAEEDDVVARINDSGADIVWVGLSTPKQERWMARFRERVNAPVMIGVGAAFDFHTGQKRQAPEVFRRNGLEWLFRAVSEPRRLGPRYAKIVPRFMAYLATTFVQSKFSR